MRRETYLLELAIFFFLGNISCLQTIERFGNCGKLPAIIAIISYSILIILYPTGCRKDLTRFIIFFFIGTSSYSIYNYFNSYFDCASINDRTFLVKGTAEGCSRSRSGKKFVEIKLERQKTIIYNIPEELHIMPGDSVFAEIIAKEVVNFTPDFDYKKYMNDKGIHFTGFLTRKRYIEVKHNPLPSIKHMAARLQIL